MSSNLKQRLGAMKARLAKGKKYRQQMKARLRKFTRRTKSSIGLPNIGRSSLYPRSQILKLKYVDNIAMTVSATSGLPAYYTFRTNSLYDPNYTGGGHQPFFRDQLAAAYKSYVVYGAYYRVTFLDNGNDKDWKLTVMPTADIGYNPAVYSGFITSEKRGSRSAVMTYQHGTRTMSGYISNAKVFGISKEKYRVTDGYSANFGSDPVDTAYLHLIMQPIDGSISIVGRAVVEITLLTRVYDPIVVDSS